MDHQKVTLKNRYGITLAADAYLPKDRGNKKLAALVISGPFYGAVKEQASGLYAQTLAERGFVTLAFDPSYTGESSGEPIILLHLISIPKTLWPQSILLDCNLMWIVNVSVSWYLRHGDCPGTLLPWINA
ncbi:alpha/beta hydrolase [Enterobacter cloacae subsp. cloacae]|nr:alpha/beta hydrolase [Enterobacter cloacae subsp. cloacae]